jgi:hypothetical protein
MFERIKFARKLWKANKAATGVRPLIAASLFPVSVPSGGFDARLKSDTFVVGYIYGVTMAYESEGDTVAKGLFIQQVFEQLFPSQGRSMTEYCTSQVLEKNPDFMRATRVGLAEMIELANSQGQKPLVTLLRHVCERYMDSAPPSR